jgi:hypothetical protein
MTRDDSRLAGARGLPQRPERGETEFVADSRPRLVSTVTSRSAELARAVGKPIRPAALLSDRRQSHRAALLAAERAPAILQLRIRGDAASMARRWPQLPQVTSISRWSRARSPNVVMDVAKGIARLGENEGRSQSPPAMATAKLASPGLHARMPRRYGGARPRAETPRTSSARHSMSQTEEGRKPFGFPPPSHPQLYKRGSGQLTRRMRSISVSLGR